jgi:hypothetical protein
MARRVYGGTRREEETRGRREDERVDSKREGRSEEVCHSIERYVSSLLIVLRIGLMVIGAGRQLFERGSPQALTLEDASLFEEGVESVDVTMFDRTERDREDEEAKTGGIHLSDSD